MVKGSLNELNFFRKYKPTGRIFGSGFSWSEASDAVANTYNGVSCFRLLLCDQRCVTKF